MRSDFNKLLTERERLSSRSSFHEVRRTKTFNQVDGDVAMGGREGMRHRYSWWYDERKQFNENLRPLRNFLQVNVGRKWDDVYSEICKNFDKRKVINQHILTHLFQYVETNTRLIDGKVCFLERHKYSRGEDGKHYKEFDYSNRWSDIKENTSFDYYVDPRTGCLRVITREGKKTTRDRVAASMKNHEASYWRIVDATHRLYKRDGVWYLITLAKLPPLYPVYIKPFWWTTPEQIAKWNALSPAEREQHGQYYMKRPEIKQIEGVPTLSSSAGGCPDGWYMATMQTASRKLLRSQGLHGD